MNGGSVDDEKDGHENDLVMPGFRFHPTEEELIDFYLRRKVEGKHFNVELITFLDLYRYDPWELPALATIGEKEWFFYVPRDRKYRNGDRPNRVTTSGYWKATGADRIIRSESSTPIGLKKTLVYYYGKAPKGIRSSWIMNEYRLPQSENNLNQKAEISICRVYKRGGTEDHLRYMRSCKPASLKGSRDDGKNKTSHLQLSSLRTPAGDHHEKIQEVISDRSTSNKMSAMVPVVPLISSATFAEDTASSIQQSDALFSTPNPSSTSSAVATARADGLIGNQHEYLNQHGYLNQLNHLLSMLSQPQILPLNGLPNPLTAVSDGLWESNPLQEAGD